MVKASKAKQDYIAAYDKENYDRVLIRFPKGTKERIQSTGISLNKFTTEAVLDRLKQFENK